MKNIKLIVGLANPIIKYDKTRHNVGSWFIQRLACYHNQDLKMSRKFLGYIGSFIYCDFKTYLFIPNTFMNLSGKSISVVLKFYRIRLDEILVVHDELDLNPGLVRFKLGCGHNGHNGIRNIIDVLAKRNNFLRIQIGIGRPDKLKQIADFVLSSPTLEEKLLIETSILRAIKMTNLLIKERNTLIEKKVLNQ
ncbi:MAG: aminoacyl-tRNA hydrolase [Buchnera aphidicola (Meitanaphis elongallis)]